MNFLEILLLVLFFVLPLIQQVLEKRRQGSAPPPDTGERPDAPRPVPGWQTPTTVNLPHTPGTGGAPVEWDPWPTTLEEVAREEVVDERQADELARAQRRMSPETVPEELRVSVPVVSLEPLTVDRAAEHRRLHARDSSVPVANRTQASPLATLLRDRGELQRSVLISELLGPPRSLQ